jgi:hypothetical protein
MLKEKPEREGCPARVKAVKENETDNSNGSHGDNGTG